MAAPVKRRELEERNQKCRENEEDLTSSESENDDNKIIAEEEGMEIEVDFEGRNPQDTDYHGIKQLLQQLFLKAHIDIVGLTDLILSQNYVGSVIKQSDDGNDSDEEDLDTVYDVFGLTTVINISERQNVPCVQQLRALLSQLSEEHATDATNTMIKNVLENDSGALGLLINERFVNIPAKISIPMLENLISEMKRAVSRKMPFRFTYYILICKLYKAPDKSSTKKKKKKNSKTQGGDNKDVEEDTLSIMWSNPEEEIFAEEATCSFEFSVEKDSDSGFSGTWTEDDDEMVPYRKVLLFEAEKLESIVDKIKNHLP